MPVEKRPGESLVGGSMNGTGSLLMKAQRVGDETLLARIVVLVAEAQRSRAPIQKIADVAASYFVPAVIAASGVTFAVWALAVHRPDALAWALVNSVAVLIIACPCALGLATPMSIVVGIGRGAKAGLLIKNAETLEALEKIDTVVVDKTGTLTEGRPRVTQIITLAPHEESELLALAAAVEQPSEHPLGRAIVGAAHDRSLAIQPADDFQSFPGGGVTGRVAGKRVVVGNAALLAEQGARNIPSLDALAEPLRRQGHTVTQIAVDGQLAGLVAIADPIKSTTRDAVRSLHSLGLRVVMFTGDNPRTAREVADSLGIDEFSAGMSPAEKHAGIARLRSAGRKVAMAGDGVNDAPALAAADVGIAIGAGTDVAIASAGVTLVGGDLRGIVRSLRLSRGVMRNIRQNIFFALVYNAIGVPIAAGALYPLSEHLLLNPMLAAAAMSLSSVSVVGNSLRLRGLKLG